MRIAIVTRHLPRQTRPEPHPDVKIVHYGDPVHGQVFDVILVLDPPIDDSMVVSERMEKWLDHLRCRLRHSKESKFIKLWEV